jgi:hypothetical protein
MLTAALLLLGATGAGWRQIIDEAALRPWLAAGAAGWLLAAWWRSRRPLSTEGRRGLIVATVGLLLPWLALLRGLVRLANGGLDAAPPLETGATLLRLAPGDGAVELSVSVTSRHPSPVILRQRDAAGLAVGARVQVVTRPGKLGLEWCDGRCVRPLAAGAPPPTPAR